MPQVPLFRRKVMLFNIVLASWPRLRSRRPHKLHICALVRNLPKSRRVGKSVAGLSALPQLEHRPKLVSWIRGFTSCQGTEVNNSAAKTLSGIEVQISSNLVGFYSVRCRVKVDVLPRSSGSGAKTHRLGAVNTMSSGRIANGDIRICVTYKLEEKIHVSSETPGTVFRDATYILPDGTSVLFL